MSACQALDWSSILHTRTIDFTNGAVAHVVEERMNGIHEAGGSSPPGSTILCLLSDSG